MKQPVFRAIPLRHGLQEDAYDDDYAYGLRRQDAQSCSSSDVVAFDHGTHFSR